MKKIKKHKWKYQINVKKKVIVLTVLGVSLFVGLGYALIGSNLGIGGILEFEKVEPKYLYNVIKDEVGNGYARKYDGEHQDSMDASKSTEDIYYYYTNNISTAETIANRNNVVFANICWKMIRTTDTGGVRLVYNGDPEITEVDGKVQYNCNDNRSIGKDGMYEAEKELYNPTIANGKLTNYYASSYTVSYINGGYRFSLVNPVNIKITPSSTAEDIQNIVDNYPYTCSYYATTTTSYTSCNLGNFYKITRPSSETRAYATEVTVFNSIGRIPVNNNNSPSDIGYMYGDVYEIQTSEKQKNELFNTTTEQFTSNISYIGTESHYNWRYSYTGKDYYGESIDWNTEENPNKYTLNDPTRLTRNNLADAVGKYIIVNTNGLNTANTAQYMLGKDGNDYYYYASLKNGEDISKYDIVMGDDIEDNGDGTYSLVSATEPIDVKTFFTNKSTYAGKYTCGDTSTSCSNPKFVYSISNSSLYYYTGFITIAKSINGTQLSDYVTIDIGKWYKNYNTTYSDYIYTCGDTSTSCSSPRLITKRNKNNYSYISANDQIAISETINGLDLVTPITITYSDWINNYDTTYKDYKYTCGDTTTTCTGENLRYITSVNGTLYKYIANNYYGKSVIYDNGEYKLQDIEGLETLNDNTKLSTHHYTCIEQGLKKCSEVAYIYYTTDDKMYYIELNDPNVTSIDQAMDAMFKKNSNESILKTNIDLWYEENLKDTVFESKIDDTIYCNNREINVLGGWNPNGGLTTTKLSFKHASTGMTLPITLDCNNTDRFSISNEQAKLKYKISVPSYAEEKLMGYYGAITSTIWEYDSNSASKIYEGYVYMSRGVIDISTGTKREAFGDRSANKTHIVRPSISLVKGTYYINGNGTMNDPYIVPTGN